MPTLPQLRLRNFLTQKALADQIGVHPRLISAWEQGLGPEEIEWPVKGHAQSALGVAKGAVTVGSAR
jgi:hypothetical protein